MKTIRFSILLSLAVTIFLTASGSSCNKEEKKSPAPDLSKGYTDAFAKKMSPKKIANLKKSGATIYEGQDPPALNGIFRAIPYVAIDTYYTDEVGSDLSGFVDYQFSNFDKVQKPVSSTEPNGTIKTVAQFSPRRERVDTFQCREVALTSRSMAMN